MTFFSGLLFGHFIDGWLFLHNWVEGWILLKLFFYSLLIDGLKVHKSACNPWKCCESCKPYKSNSTFNAGNNHGEKNSFSNLSVLSKSTARSSDVASPKCWNLVWDTASRSKKRQDMLQMWEGHGSCNPPGIPMVWGTFKSIVCFNLYGFVQGHNDGAKGTQFPMAPNHYGGHRISAGDAEKFQQCHKYFLQCSTFASERPQVGTWGVKFVSCSGHHLTSLRPWFIL